MKQNFLVIFFFHLTFLLISQEVKRGDVYNYARKVIDTMASESMHGRGYVNGGDRIAAAYIKSEFQKFGLKSFTTDYYQKFTFDVNTFPANIDFNFRLESNKKNLKGCCFNGIPGKNFLISADSPNETKSFHAIVFDSTFAVEKKFEKFKNKVDSNNPFIIVDDRDVTDKSKLQYFEKVKANYFKTGGIIELVKKLTWEPSQNVVDYIKIQIPSDSFSFKEKEFVGNVVIQNLYILQYPAQNIIGYVQGSVYPDSFIVFSAHYDHLGQMGKDVYFPGANDNASGCAMLLNLAKYYSRPENTPKYSIAFISFGGEEVGLVGSKYYTEHPLFPLKNIKFLLNMDIMGTGEDGITVVNGTVFKEEFEKLKQINTQNDFIKEVKLRGKASNSDHYFFSENGVHAFFIYTLGGIKAYHDIYDRAETLPLNEFEDLFKLITKFGDYLQN